MSNFIWYDLMVPDLKSAMDFYAHVVGWTIADSGMPGMSYQLLHAGDVMVGGMMATTPDMQQSPGWMGHVHAADTDAAVKKVQKLGGTLFREAQDIPGIGRFAVVGDTSGAPFILFTPISSEQPQKVAEGTPGHIGWRELMSANWEKDFAFYAALCGWTKTEAIDMGPMGTYQLFDTGKGQGGGMMTKPAQDPSPPHWNYYFNVESMAAGMARAKSKGARFFRDPMQVPGGGFAVNGMDPQGVAFSLFSMKE